MCVWCVCVLYVCGAWEEASLCQIFAFKAKNSEACVDFFTFLL